MISRLFDAGLQTGVDYGNQQLGIATGVNQATRLGITANQLTAGNNATQPAPAGFDSKTLLIVGGVLVLALLLARS